MSAQSIIDEAFSLITGEGLSNEGLSDVGFTIPTGFSNIVNFAAPVIVGSGANPELMAGNARALAALTNFSATIPGTLAQPTFTGDNADLAIEDLLMPGPPEFLTAVTHSPAPTDTFANSPVTLPVFTGLTSSGDAGLTPPVFPSFEPGERAELDSLDVTAFSPVTLELFDEDLPEYEIPELLSKEDPNPATYTADAALLSAMSLALQTGELLTDTAQAAMVSERVEDLLREQEREIAKIKSDLAARGFFLPTGATHGSMLLVVEKVLRAQEKASVEVRDEAFERAKKILTTAAEGGLALEAKHLELHLSYIEHLMQVRRFNVKMAADVLDVAVKLYNQKVGALRPHLNAYKAYINAVKQQNSAPAVLAQMKQALLQTVEADVNMYDAQMKTFTLNAEVDGLRYEPYINEVKEYISKTKRVAENVKRLRFGIEAFQSAVEVYKERAENDILRAKANQEEFGNWVQGESLRSAQARTNAAYIQAVASRGQRYGTMVDGVGQTISQATQAYSRYVSANQTYLSAYSNKLSAAAKISAAYDSATNAALHLASAQTRVDGSVASVNNQKALIDAEHATRQEIINALDATHDETIRANQLAAQAKTAASIAQAAYGIFGANISVSGTASAGDTGSYKSFLNYYENANRRYELTKRTNV